MSAHVEPADARGAAVAEFPGLERDGTGLRGWAWTAAGAGDAGKLVLVRPVG